VALAVVSSVCGINPASPLLIRLMCGTLQVKDYRHQSSPAQISGGIGNGRNSSGCLEERCDRETVDEQAKQGMIRQTSDERTQFVIPASRCRSDRVLSDETNVHQSCLLRKQNLLTAAHCLRSRLPRQVCYSCHSYRCVFAAYDNRKSSLHFAIDDSNIDNSW